MKLKNKVAIITGGAGGIGKTISKYYLTEGANIVIAEIDNLGLETIINELNCTETDRLLGIHADITDIRQVENLIIQTMTTFGTIDILVNVAGIQKPIGKLVDIDIDEWIKNININLIGTVSCCKYVLPIMISKKRGKIINFSGGGATFSRPHFSAYAAAKAAIVRFTETIADEVRDFGVDINAISPGPVYTKMLEEIISAGSNSGEKDLNIAIKSKITGGTSPELSAKLAVFLASSASDGITGKLISTVWDDWNNFDKKKSDINNSSLFTLRRIDGIRFIDTGTYEN